jgi:hypothetical protein
MTPKEAEKFYGKKTWKKMQKYLDGITIAILPNGEKDIPEVDLDHAIRELNGEDISDWD